jgi:CRISPR system Cascade subunit CasD
MPALLLRLSGPMQSWGTRSRFEYRDTERVPSKSGVIGLLCAALGRPREAPLEDLVALRMAVRVDRPGVLSVDYHTTLGVAKAGGGIKDCQPSRRHYLAGAVFLVGLGAEERQAALLAELQEALAAPVWPLCLGRKAFPPGEPVRLPDGLRDEELERAICQYPWLVRPLPWQREQSPELDVEWENPPGVPGEPRQDVPRSFAHHARSFGLRWVHSERIPNPDHR